MCKKGILKIPSVESTWYTYKFMSDPPEDSKRSESDAWASIIPCNKQKEASTSKELALQVGFGF